MSTREAKDALFRGWYETRGLGSYLAQYNNRVTRCDLTFYEWMVHRADSGEQGCRGLLHSFYTAHGVTAEEFNATTKEQKVNVTKRKKAIDWQFRVSSPDAIQWHIMLDDLNYASPLIFTTVDPPEGMDEDERPYEPEYYVSVARAVIRKATVVGVPMPSCCNAGSRVIDHHRGAVYQVNAQSDFARLREWVRQVKQQPWRDGGVRQVHCTQVLDK